MPNRFSELDGLRGIAALWVVIFHLFVNVKVFWLKDDPTLASAITPWSPNFEGLLAVHLFFIISGFVIFMTIERSQTVMDFAISRFARLYPAFWAALVLTVFLAVSLPSPVQPITTAEVSANATMLQLYIGFPSVEGVYWSLSFEIGFYFLIAAAFSLRLLPRIEIIGVLWMLISFLVLKAFPVIGQQIPWKVQTLFALPYACLFFAGILFYKIRANGHTIMRWILLALCYAEYVALSEKWSWVLIMTPVFVLFALCIAGRARWLSIGPLVFLGTISYPLYLVHASLVYRLQVFAFSLGMSQMIGAIFALTVALCVAASISFGIERPANRAIRAIYRRLRPEKAAPALTGAA